MGIGLGSQADIGAAGVRLGGGVGVIDNHRHLVGVVHLTPNPELLTGIKAIKSRRSLSVDHGDMPLGAIGAFRARQYPACLVRVVGAGMLDHGIDQVGTNTKH